MGATPVATVPEHRQTTNLRSMVRDDGLELSTPCRPVSSLARRSFAVCVCHHPSGLCDRDLIASILSRAGLTVRL
jgi:hypothetical protein